MNDELQYDPACCCSRWLAYFDLLGIRELLRSGGHLSVFSIYERATREVTRLNSRLPRIRHAWFSDSFLIYSEGATVSDFVEIDMISRWFVHFLILAEIPLRGAMACGDFYADSNWNVYLGEALIEAYECGEAQDWIGFVLAPAAIRRLDEVGLPARDRLNYAYHDIPSKETGRSKCLPACILGSWAKLNGANQLLPVLARMKARHLKDSIKGKYQSTISFIEEHQRGLPLSGQPLRPANGG